MRSMEMDENMKHEAGEGESEARCEAGEHMGIKKHEAREGEGEARCEAGEIPGKNEA